MTARARAVTVPAASGQQTGVALRWLAPLALPAAIAAAVLLVGMLTVRPYLVGSFFDDGVYVILGKALATGQGYRYLHLPGHPVATHYPPGYPVLLAALWRIAPEFPANVAVFQFANALLLAAAAVGSYVFAVRRLGCSPAWSAAIAMGGSVAIPVLAQTTMVISEPLFVALLMPTLLTTERAVDSGGAEARSSSEGLGGPRVALVAGAMCGALALVRSVGGVAIPAALAVGIARRRYRAAACVSLSSLVLLLPWQLWLRSHGADLAPELRGAYGSYAAWVLDPIRQHGLAFAAGTANMNAIGLLRIPLVQMTPDWPTWAKAMALAGSAVLLVVGLRRLSATAPVTAAFYCLYMVEVVLWPFPPYRFFWTMWPVTVMICALAIRAIWSWRPVGVARHASRLATLVVVSVPALAFAGYNVAGYRGHWWSVMQDNRGPRIAHVVASVSRHTTSGGPVVSEEGPAVYLYAGREGVPGLSSFAEEFLYHRDTARDRAYLDAVLRRFPARLVVASSPEVVAAASRLATQTPPLLTTLDTLAPATGVATFTRVTP